LVGDVGAFELHAAITSNEAATVMAERL